MTVEIDLPLRVSEGYRPKTVKARILHDIAPHLAHVATFAISREDDGEYGFLYRITNVETGNRVRFGYGSEPLVIAEARALLAQKTPAQVLSAMEAAVTRGYR